MPLKYLNEAWYTPSQTKPTLVKITVFWGNPRFFLGIAQSLEMYPFFVNWLATCHCLVGFAWAGTNKRMKILPTLKARGRTAAPNWPAVSSG